MSRLTKAVRKLFGITRRHSRAEGPMPTSAAQSSAERIISVHIPKCAGTSLLKALQTHYGEALLLDYQDIPLDPQSLFQTEFAAWSEAQRAALARDYSSVAAVHGHFWAGKYDAVLPGARKITWLRDPVRRVISHYYYWKTKPSLPNSLHRQFVEKNFSLTDFAECSIMQNIFTQTFLRNHHLSDFFFVGVCEFFGEDMERLQRQLGWSVATAPQENRTEHPEYDPLKVDPEMEHRIRKLNQADIDLYQAALERRRNELRANESLVSTA